jgi:hypothetical protein
MGFDQGKPLSTKKNKFFFPPCVISSLGVEELEILLEKKCQSCKVVNKVVIFMETHLQVRSRGFKP